MGVKAHLYFFSIFVSKTEIIRNMPRPKGTPKTGGRKKGSTNKVDSATREFLKNIVENNQDKIKKELEKLDGKPYLDAVLSLMEYVQPKLNRTELTGDTESPLKIIVGE
jgi:hypothetical protein